MYGFRMSLLIANLQKSLAFRLRDTIRYCPCHSCAMLRLNVCYQTTHTLTRVSILQFPGVVEPVLPSVIVLAKCHSQSKNNIHRVGNHGRQLPRVPCSPLLHLKGSYSRLALPTPVRHSHLRNVHLSSLRADKEPLKPSSKVEETVTAIKENLLAKEKASVTKTAISEVAESLKQRPSLWVRFKDECRHYFHGFRLFLIDLKVCVKLLYRLSKGKTLSRREYRQLVRTTSDFFRLVPFSVFIIIPFMEILLPVALKLFPSMLPSTFQTANEKEAKMKKNLSVKLEMAKFLQRTLDDMTLEGKGHNSESAKEFITFYEKIRTSGQLASNEDIMKFSKLFEDEITLDSLSHPQLKALCRVLELTPIGTPNFLRFQLRLKLRSLAADDKMIQKEGVNTLTIAELQQACRARGMRAYGVSETRLHSQLSQWLDLSLNERVPPSLLLLSRALFVPVNLPTHDQLAATISALPESVATQTKAVISEREGKMDHKTRIEVIKDEEKKIREEREERRKEKAALLMKEEQERKKAEEEMLKELDARDQEVLAVEAAAKLGEKIDDASLSPAASKPHPVTAQEIMAEGIAVTKKATVSKEGDIMEDKELLEDIAPVLKDKAQLLEGTAVDQMLDVGEEKEKEELSSEDMNEIQAALRSLAEEKHKIIIEKEEIEDLKEEMADYKEDIEDLNQVLITAGKTSKELRESKGAQRLFHKVSKMIGSMDQILDTLHHEEKELRAQMHEQEGNQEQQRAELVSIEELIQAVEKMQKIPDTTKLGHIAEILIKMDDDKDGAVKVEDLLKVIELVGKDNVHLTIQQMNEIIVMFDKEEILEIEQKIEKMLVKEQQERAEEEEKHQGGIREEGSSAQKKQKVEEMKEKGVKAEDNTSSAGKNGKKYIVHGNKTVDLKKEAKQKSLNGTDFTEKSQEGVHNERTQTGKVNVKNESKVQGNHVVPPIHNGPVSSSKVQQQPER